MLTDVRGTTATVASAGRGVAIVWDLGTVIVDTEVATAKIVRIGSCVLVLPPPDGPVPTAHTLTAAVVRVVPDSPSCPRIPGAGVAPGQTAGPPAGTAGSITLTGGPGVIGRVRAVSRKGFTLKSANAGRVRTVAVSTSPATRYREAGTQPRTAVEDGRCAIVWGDRHRGARLVATRISMTDAVGGKCQSSGLS